MVYLYSLGRYEIDSASLDIAKLEKKKLGKIIDYRLMNFIRTFCS